MLSAITLWWSVCASQDLLQRLDLMVERFIQRLYGKGNGAFAVAEETRLEVAKLSDSPEGAAACFTFMCSG